MSKEPLLISVSGLEDCNSDEFGVFDIYAGENSYCTFDAFGPIIKSVENVLKRDGVVKKDTLIEEISVQTNNKYGLYDEEDNTSLCITTNNEQFEICMERSISNCWISIDNEKNIQVGQFFIEWQSDGEYYDDVPEIISSHWQDAEWSGTPKEWRKLRSFIQYQNGGENRGPWMDGSGKVYSLHDQNG